MIKIKNTTIKGTIPTSWLSEKDYLAINPDDTQIDIEGEFCITSNKVTDVTICACVYSGLKQTFVEITSPPIIEACRVAAENSDEWINWDV